MLTHSCGGAGARSLLAAVCAVAFAALGCGKGARAGAPNDLANGGASGSIEEPAGAEAGADDASSAGSGDAPRTGWPPMLDPPCNGREQYCSVPYDELCFAATHDSAANSADYWVAPAQDLTVREQLQNGVRALMLDIFDNDGVATVCNHSCSEGSTPFSEVLGDVATFLADNPRVVITLLLESELPASVVATEFKKPGLGEQALVQALDAPWPTLGELIESEHRLVVLADAPGEGPAWLLPRAAFVWETNKDWPTLAAMNCNPVVGTGLQPLYVVHHNLIEGGEGGEGGSGSALALPNAELATKANELAALARRLEICRMQHGHVPSFVAVDFSSRGDVVDATQVVNGVRTVPP